MPVPATVIPLPKNQLIVVVSATAFPLASTTERFVVCGPLGLTSALGISADGVALSGLMVARWASAQAGEGARRAGSGRSPGIAEPGVPRGERAAHRFEHDVELGRRVPRGVW